jgi:virginiamycin B lyase
MERIVHLRWAQAAMAAVLLLVVSAGLVLGSGEPGTLTSWTVPTSSSTPSGILAVDGVVYFGESTAGQLGRLDPTTNAVTEWNVGDGPQELALGPAGGVYLTERWGDRIGRILPGGGFYTSETASASGSEPSGIASDLTGVGTLWYTQRAAGKLTRLSLGGLLFDVLMVQFPSTQSVTPSSAPLVPTTLTVAPRVTPGNPFLPPGIALAPSTTSGPYVHYEIGGTATYLRDLAIAPDGTIYVSTEARSIRQFNPSSGTLLYHDLPSDSASYYVDVDDAGAVWFTESSLARVGRMTPSSGDVVEWTIPSSQPLGILAAPDGTVWFTDRTGDRIGHLEPATNSVTLYPLAAWSRPTDLTLDAAGDVWFVTEANWIGRLALGPVLGPPPLAEGITGIHLTPTSPTTATVAVDYVYWGGAGLPIYVGGLPTIGGATAMEFGYVPGAISSVGSGSASFSLTYMGADCRTTDGFTAYLYGADRALITTESVSTTATWGPCVSVSPGLPAISLTVDRGCGGAYAIGDSISISITPSETVTASLVDFQTGGTQSLINVGTIPGGTTRIVRGTITGPVGTEAVVVRAETASGLWISAGCTLAVGGASVGAVSLGVDRVCGATYRYGETATASLQSSVAGLAKLYQVTRAGAVSLVTVLPIFPGVTERVSAPIGATTGTSTFVLEVTAASGQLHAATCSYSVVP